MEILPDASPDITKLVQSSHDRTDLRCLQQVGSTLPTQEVGSGLRCQCYGDRIPGKARVTEIGLDAKGKVGKC